MTTEKKPEPPQEPVKDENGQFKTKDGMVQFAPGNRVDLTR